MIKKHTQNNVDEPGPQLVVEPPPQGQFPLSDDGPIMYDCTTASEMIDGLVCDCKGKKRCKNECPCFVTGMSCIELCFCESDEQKCHNPKTFFDESSESLL